MVSPVSTFTAPEQATKGGESSGSGVQPEVSVTRAGVMPANAKSPVTKLVAAMSIVRAARRTSSTVSPKLLSTSRNMV